MTTETLAEHLPSYIAVPGEADPLFVAVVIMVVVGVFAIGVFYFKLHALPEHMSHSANRTQFQLVAILALVALFTHNNLFWIAALLLAAVQIPDLMGRIDSMARSLERMADTQARTADPDVGPDLPAQRAPASNPVTEG